MKKSYMVELLADMLRHYRKGGELSYLTNQEAAKHLLQQIETIGMQPPRVAKEDIDILYSVYIDCNINLWDEDLQQDENYINHKNKRLNK
jgi:hypothetical protein